MFNNKGVSHIVILVVIIVVAAVGFAGWRVYTSENNTTEQAAVEVQQPNEELQNAEDVKALEQELSSTDLESELSTSDLDANLDELQ
jgi:predicted negative regulator of RcsB-dependent stress response